MADSPPEPDFDQALAEVERSLQSLQDRYAQVCADQDRQQSLKEQLHQTQRQYQQTRTKSLRAELNRLQTQLDELEIALESQLFSWQGLREIFWQAVRFGGLGIIIGWLLKSYAG